MLGEAKTDRWPYATTALIGVNLLVFGFGFLSACAWRRSCSSGDWIPPALTPRSALATWSRSPRRCFCTPAGCSCSVNLWFLWLFGDAVEGAIGWRWFLTLYLACGIVANVVFAVASSGTATPAVGAGGAIAGVLGAGVVLWPRARMRVLAMLVIFVALMLLYEAGLAIGDLGDRSQHRRRLRHRRRPGPLCPVGSAHPGAGLW